MDPASDRPPFRSPAGPPIGPVRHRGNGVVLGIPGVFVVLALLLLIFALAPAAFGLPASPSPYRFGPVGGAFALFFLLIVGFFVVRVIFWSRRAARFRGPSGTRYGMDRAARVARMRYARGEITREQYDQILPDLGRRPGPP